MNLYGWEGTLSPGRGVCCLLPLRISDKNCLLVYGYFHVM